jgi:hypothetical protein
MHQVIWFLFILNTHTFTQLYYVSLEQEKLEIYWSYGNIIIINLLCIISTLGCFNKFLCSFKIFCFRNYAIKIKNQKASNFHQFNLFIIQVKRELEEKYYSIICSKHLE